jgi:RNA polymerase sigma-70 factor (ECF subfamily)
MGGEALGCSFEAIEFSVGSEEITDADLAAAARAGSEAAFAALYRRHVNQCQRVAFRILHDSAESEEVVQVAFLKAYWSLDQLQDLTRVAGWLRRIVANCSLMRLRERSTQRARYRLGSSKWHQPDGEITLSRVAVAPGNPEQVFMERQSKEILRSEIRRLPGPLRQVLTAQIEEDAPISDVAAGLGISLPAAKSRLQRARAELRTRLIESGRLQHLG